MKKIIFALLIGYCFLMMPGFYGSAHAIWLDKGQTIWFSGELQTRLSLRTESSEGFTIPEVDQWDMVQHRNLLYAEIKHDLRKLNLPAGIDASYYLKGRLFYEGVYDYGPGQFKDLPDENYVKDIDDFKMDADLWEAYADISGGPVFLRLGRQNLSWGETDVFRLLDNINPLDNTFGGIFEDLDDRRIPLIMARGSYNFGDLGFVSSFTLEGFWVPGELESTVAPGAPPGTPYAPPIPPASQGSIPGVLSLSERRIEPESDNSSSRWGARLQGVIGNNLTFAIAHYKTFLDDPGVRLVVDQQFVPGPVTTPASVTIEQTYDRVSITGASFNYYEGLTNTVIRSEFAYLEDVPVFIPDVNAPGPTLIPSGLPSPLPPAFPQFNNGEIPRKDQIRFSLSLDKDIWVRALNPRGAFNCTLQYTGQIIQDYDDRMRMPVPVYPSATAYDISVKEYEQSFTLLLMNTTGWMNGNLTPEFVAAYDPRGAWLIQPSVQYRFDPFQVKLTYSNISGNFVGMGVFRDRDQITASFSWLF